VLLPTHDAMLFDQLQAGVDLADRAQNISLPFGVFSSLQTDGGIDHVATNSIKTGGLHG
jgi:hypothetical protein